MKIGVYGTGAVGGLIGGALVSSDAKVLFVGRASLESEIRQKGGIMLTSHKGKAG
jgi:ketopantoate reductase